MMNKDKVKIIFLDIDGVLNGFTLFTHLIYKLFYLIKKEDWLIKHYNVFDVQRKRFKLLKDILDKTGAEVVLCSSLRFKIFNVPFEDQPEKCKKISLYLFENNIEIIDVVPELDTSYKREDEINMWLISHKDEVSNYIIIDDDPSEYPHLGEKHMVQTSKVSNGEFITGSWLDKSGIKRKHVKKAIEMLK